MLLLNSRAVICLGKSMTHRLFVYGTLAPGRPNEQVLADIPGEWEPATVAGTLHQEGWGAEVGYPGIVLEEHGGEVEGFLFSSESLAEHGTPLPSPVAIATGLAAPEGLTVDTDGGLLVAETGIGRVAKIDVATGAVTTVASNLAFGNNPVIPFVGPPTSPTWLSFTTVVVSPTSNDLYVAGDNADVPPRHRTSVIYKIER
jgi:hypothetical protein